MLVHGCWLLVLGSWFLVLGSWFLVVGGWWSECGGSCVAGRVGDAAGGLGVWRSLGFAFQILGGGYQGSLAEARQPFAMVRSPFGAGGWLSVVLFGDGVVDRSGSVGALFMARGPKFWAQAPAALRDGGPIFCSSFLLRSTGPASFYAEASKDSKAGTTVRRGRDSVLLGFSSRCVFAERKDQGRGRIPMHDSLLKAKW
jgi:hypothetical protein